VASLRIIANPGGPEERAFEVRVGTMTIGRTKDNDVFVLHKSLSRQHARLENDGATMILTDLESKNGTFLGRDRIAQRVLAAGERFRCGDVVFELRDGSAVPSDVPTPSLVAESRRNLSEITIEDLLGPPSTYGSLRLASADGATRARDRLDVLLKVAQLLGKPSEIDGLLGDVVDLLLRIMDVDRVAVLLIDEASGRLVPRITRAARGAAPERFFSAHIVEWVREHRTAALFGDAVADAPADAVASIIAQSICSSICAPLQIGGRLLGVLYADNLSTPDRFTQEDLDFLSAFASQVAVAIENSALWRRVEREAALRSTLTRFFPPATIQRIHQDGGAALGVIETEVTALFADISGFTAMSSTMTPRSIVDMLNEYFPLMADAVFRHGGTLEKYIGDALMAVWGAPFATPDDVEHAVQAAVEMQRDIETLNGKLTRSGHPPIRIHIGLNTGTVAAGNIGSDRYLQYATIGDATNVASRACNCAGPGQIVITEATRARLRGVRWLLSPMPPVVVKGKAEPLSIHSVQWNDTGRAGR
jgi:adenylate cyclase